MRNKKAKERASLQTPFKKYKYILYVKRCKDTTKILNNQNKRNK